MKYFLGIDIGATKSHALIANQNGEAVGFGSAGPGNWEAVGWEETQRVFHVITAEAIQSAQIERAQIAGAGFGIAGYDWPEDLAPHQRIANSLQLGGPIYLTNDTIIGLVAGATDGWGVVVSAGTSNNCRGRNQAGQEAYLTGAGSSFAEYGGAHEMVQRAIQSISRAWSQRGPATQLTERFIQLTKAQDATDFLAGIMRGRYQIHAGLAPEVFAVAQAGDPVAQEIITWTGQQLGDLALGIIRQLDFRDIEFEVVMAGSLYRGGAALIDAMKNTIWAEAPKAQFVHLKAPPVVGGVLLGMQQCGLAIPPVRQHLIQTTTQFLAEQEN